MIASYTPGTQAELVRNPHFRQWSPAAQPAGYADRIHFEFGLDPERATTAVERGQADLLLANPPTDRLQEIQTRFSAQNHPFSLLGVYFMFLNTSIPPFDHRDVRRALSYAVDRAKMASAVVPVEGTGGGPVTCQAIPPNLPGYAPYCPYTVPTTDGAWKAPDLTRVQALIDASETKDVPITVWSGPVLAAPARYVASVLKTFGYQVTVQVIPDPDRYNDWIRDSGNHAQIGGNAWVADIPAPSNAIARQLTCKAFTANDPQNQNLAQFCDPALDAQIRIAQRLEITDPPRANTLWAQIDRRVVDEAPLVPFTIPSGTHIVSARAGNYQYNPVLGPLVGQLWVN